MRGDCLLYTSDAADERSSVDLGGRRIIKNKKNTNKKKKKTHQNVEMVCVEVVAVSTNMTKT